MNTIQVINQLSDYLKILTEQIDECFPDKEIKKTTDEKFKYMQERVYKMKSKSKITMYNI
jgi:hypothetical protein